MQPRLQRAPPPQCSAGTRAQGPALRQPDGERGSGLCLGQSAGLGEGLPTAAWPMAIASESPCINSRSCTDPTATPCSPIWAQVVSLSPISPSWCCPMAADPPPSLPTVPQASKLSAGLMLQVGKGGRGGDEGHAGLEPPRGGRHQNGDKWDERCKVPLGLWFVTVLAPSILYLCKQQVTMSMHPEPRFWGCFSRVLADSCHRNPFSALWG